MKKSCDQAQCVIIPSDEHLLSFFLTIRQNSELCLICTSGLFPSYLQLVDQPFLDRILCSGVCCHAETFGRLSQFLLLLFTVGVCSCTLGWGRTHVNTDVTDRPTESVLKHKYNGRVRRRPTLAASTILAVASARSLAADSSLREFSRSDSPSASILMALTRSDVAWARIRACRTISPGEFNEREWKKRKVNSLLRTEIIDKYASQIFMRAVIVRI